MRTFFVSITMFLGVILPFSVFAQRLTVTIPCTDTITTLFLYDTWGDNHALLDSAQRNTLTGKYEFSLPGNLPAGVYQLRFGVRNMDVILTEKEKQIEFSVCQHNPLQTIKVTRSIENAVYYDFLRVNEGLLKAIGALESAILRYPSNEEFFDTLAQKYHRLQNERLAMIDDVERLYPDSYVAKIVSMYRMPFLNAYWNKATRNKVMREDFFYDINTADTTLLRSDVYIEKAMQYMEMYMSPDASYDALQQDLIAAVDKILGAYSANKKVFGFILEYITYVMTEYHFNAVLSHISENWMNSDCDDTSESRLQSRIKGYHNLTIGTQAPSFAVRDREEAVLKLEDIPAEYILMVFYTSTCSHCRQLMLKIVEKRRKTPAEKLEIIAISIDESEEEWERYISTNDFEWINVRDSKGWDGTVVSAYSIYSTPMIFLLDKTRKIIAKPDDWNDLKNIMKDYGI